MNKFTDFYLTTRGVLKHNFIRKFENQSSDYIESFKINRLTKILISSYKEIPYYRNLFWKFDFNPEKFKQLSDLNKIPILTKEQLFKHYWEINSSFKLKHSIKTQTTGTTGQVLTSYTSKKQWIIEQAAIWNQWKKAGYNFRDKICILRSFEGSKKNYFYMDKLKNWLYCSPYYLNEKNCSKILNFLKTWKVNFLRGYPSSILLLSRHAKKQGIQLNHLKSILIASEFLSKDHREEIEKTFSVKIFNHYGQAETSCMFHQLFSDDDNLYNLEYYGHAELIPTSKTKIYKLVATNLWNDVMPLIRYDTGDLVNEKQYSKKIKFLGIKNIYGRRAEYLVNANNEMIPATQFYTFFSKIKNLDRFQIIQNTKTEILLNLNFTDNKDTKTQIRKIQILFRKIFEKQVNLKLDNKFVLKGEGKFNPLIQNLKIR